MIRSILIISFCICFYSCRSTSPVESALEQIPDFPGAVGNSWTYTTFDSLTNSQGIITVKIIQDLSGSDNSTLQLWEFQDGTKAETIHVSIKKDTVLFSNQLYQPISSTRGISKLVFPIKTGNGWRITGVPRYDTVFISNNKSFTVPAGVFPNSFKIEEHFRGLNRGGMVIIQFVPKIGIIWMLHTEGDFSPASTYNQVWQLKSYSIK